MDSVAGAQQIGQADEQAVSADADRSLARRISAGDAEAWQLFFDQHFSWAYRFAYHHLSGNRADAEDLCSDILLTAARSIKSYDGNRGTLDVWLLGLARHRLARFCRGRRIELPLVPEVSEPVADGRISDLPTDSSLTRILVNRALSSLPQRQAAALIGRYVSGHTVEELARSTQSTPKAIESLLSRARAAFRAAFAALLNDTPGGDSHGQSRAVRR
jgi:RNA polymerase sigma-70 factor (ECF subfamily)